MEVPEFYVLRHGETEWNVAGRMQGALDSALTARGRAQARAMADCLANRLGDRLANRLAAQEGALSVISSPQGRALATAQIVATRLGLPVSTDPRLSEIAMGAWTGLTLTQIAARWPREAALANLFDWYGAIPDGEPLSAVRARLHSFLADQSRPAIVVTHGLTGLLLRTALMRGEAPSPRTAEQGVVYHLSQGVQRRLTPPDCP
ncbi:Glucosyl-3-phosphoglycerate phosphatase [Aquimixticola soesokkakensis]|uniref:Glucosyl-3-phosphoglycerate phosphatase n=1 Tax=Aquimixticola soesokkakensis TaxID=1519096 RepID=A0A1Y5SMS4_9RHOB|nr:Glucosyl-3-phosphoglycerate phosphatase [Aquimixticola soesokkakensis]